ncbi:MAG TPA: DUF2442 domain-containing protein [Burkholderiaceae bacterium]|jgi:hypothetical protein|nr:DUF2442 domain-containing protein [Burkholderiaceae bacterium]
MADRPTDSEFRKANARGRRVLQRSPKAIAAKYSRGRVLVELDTDWAFSFPVAQAQGLANAPATKLRDIRISPTGLGLHWPQLDADLYVPALVRGLSGTRQWMSQIGRIGGARRSEAKAAAARRNGAKGGRPRRQS